MKLTKAQREVLERATRSTVFPQHNQWRMFDRLHDAGYLTVERSGGFIRYFLTDAGRAALKDTTHE